MDRHETNAQLKSAYRAWKAAFNPDGIALATFGPPILLCATEAYCAAQRKVLVYGQETFGWQWGSDLQKCYPSYPTNWHFGTLHTLADFLKNDDAVDGLCWGYREFDCAKHQPSNWQSPLWVAFRKIQSWPGVGALHSNISKVDFQGRAFIDCFDALSKDRMIQEQSQIVVDELKILKPDICIFLTGPNYDDIVKAVFPNVTFETVSDVSRREFARMRHPDLPEHAYRTYHPQHLQLTSKLFYLDTIGQIVAGLTSGPSPAVNPPEYKFAQSADDA